MGIIARQSFYNILSIMFAFALGGLNTIVFYPRVMGPEFHGLVGALLANSNIIQPLFSYGIQFSVIKFYSACKTQRDQDNLLIFSIVLPLFVIIPLTLMVYQFDFVLDYFFKDQSKATDYLFLILSIAISTAYFEIFYSWLRIQKKTVFGNFLKEVYQRVMITILISFYLIGWLDFNSFLYALIGGYYLRLFLILSYALRIYTPKIHWEFPNNTKVLLRYCSYIFLTGFSASIILDLDKSMIKQYLTTDYVSFYMVAIFIAAVIDTPSRAMVQIVSPLVAESLNTNNKSRLEELLKKSSLNLLLISGLLFVVININLQDIYKLIEILNTEKGYVAGLPIILLISVTKLFSSSLGCLNNIITNSKYYRYLLIFSVASALAAVVLNIQFISTYGFIGAAIATLIVVTTFNLLKIILVFYKFKIHPFSIKSIWILFLILALYLIFVNVNLDYHPFVSVSLKSIIVGMLYFGVSYFLGLSNEVNQFLNRLLKKQ
ncbi:MAG: oligosaccharide flippase family protein [Flavobacteriaceae bacterium]|nr:oligosaccharide flippase family protein [Flavobacteriaceae bacterium]